MNNKLLLLLPVVLATLLSCEKDTCELLVVAPEVARLSGDWSAEHNIIEIQQNYTYHDSYKFNLYLKEDGTGLIDNEINLIREPIEWDLLTDEDGDDSITLIRKSVDFLGESYYLMDNYKIILDEQNSQVWQQRVVAPPYFERTITVRLTRK
jgi:hypothetical protein